MKADKFGTAKEQKLWHMGYLRPSERTKPIDHGCKQCKAGATVADKLYCIYYGGDQFATAATAICSKFIGR